MSQPRRPSNQNRPSVTRNAPGGLRFGMFAVCVIRDGSPDLAGKPKELYTVLVTFSDVQARDTDKGYPYRTALAKAMGCSTKTVDRATAALEKMGLVTTHRRKLPGSSENDANRYELHDGWLIQGMEPGPDVPPQLVARYGHLIPGFDVEAFLGVGTPVSPPLGTWVSLQVGTWVSPNQETFFKSLPRELTSLTAVGPLQVVGGGPLAASPRPARRIPLH